MFGFQIVLQWLYQLYQYIVIFVFSPKAPKSGKGLRNQRIAIVGAGLTGVSAAAHCVGHGFNVVIFEAGSRKNLGGIWSRVNHTSGLQIHSLMYRFHPSVHWDKGFPDRERILKSISEVWKQYKLQDKTRFDTTVEKVRQREDGKWIVNGNENETFDGILACVGTCGEPKMPFLPGQNEFKGQIVHSSQLDDVDVEGKNVAIVGGGASAVEALEYVISNGAKKVSILARTDKWIIPRNPFIDVLLSIKPIGYEDYFAYIPEYLLRKFFYRDLQDLAPKSGLWESTPMVNEQVLDQIRKGKVQWLRGDIQKVNENGIDFNKRTKGVPKGGPGTFTFAEADVISWFLPPEAFQEPYCPPAWYLQTFPPGFPTVCAVNSTYVNAIGTVGHFHIGAYTRMLLMFLADPITQPSEKLMKVWVDVFRWLKSFAPSGAFDFFTYGELMLWFVVFILVRPSRWRWMFFVLNGWGMRADEGRSVAASELVNGDEGR